MSWRPHPKYARTDPSNPQAWGTCDRSGFVHNLENLVQEYEWAGTTLMNKHVLVGERYVDEPNEQLRAIRIPEDPDPIINARPENYSIDEGLMPLTTEKAYPGDPGQVVRVDSIRPGTPFVLGQGILGGVDPLAGTPTTTYVGVETDTNLAPTSEGTFVLDHSDLDSEDAME
jgi:hypothetical protein